MSNQCYCCDNKTTSQNLPPLCDKCHGYYVDESDKFEEQDETIPMFVADEDGLVMNKNRLKYLEQLFEASVKMREIFRNQHTSGARLIHENQLDRLGWFGILRTLESK